MRAGRFTNLKIKGERSGEGDGQKFELQTGGWRMTGSAGRAGRFMEVGFYSLE